MGRLQTAVRSAYSEASKPVQFALDTPGSNPRRRSPRETAFGQGIVAFPKCMMRRGLHAPEWIRVGIEPAIQWSALRKRGL